MVVGCNPPDFLDHFAVHAKSGGKTDKIPNSVGAKHVFLDDIFIPASFLFQRHKTAKLYNRDSLFKLFYDSFVTCDS